jgi:hypothetical protein
MKRSEVVQIFENLKRVEGVEGLTIAKLERAIESAEIDIENNLSPVPPSQQEDQRGLD